MTSSRVTINNSNSNKYQKPQQPQRYNTSNKRHDDTVITVTISKILRTEIEIERIQLGSYRILRYPKLLRNNLEQCLSLRTVFLPKPKCWATMIFITFCYLVMEWFASVFAGRTLTNERLVPDALLAICTISAGLTTAMTDPGILPPDYASEAFTVIDNDDSKNNNNNNNNKNFQVERDFDAIGVEAHDTSLEGVPRNPYLLKHNADYAKASVYNLTRCRFCYHLRPHASSHCPKCNTCVLGFDHHCGFLSCDIGQRNLRFFILFIVGCLTCVGHATLAFFRPYYDIFVNHDATLLDSAVVRSNLALGVACLALGAWSVLMFLMVANYIIMLFVPGASSTREVWRKICGKSNSSSSMGKSDPLPSWHPGFEAQQQELAEERKKEKEPIRFWRTFFGIPPSLIPDFIDELLEEEEEEEESRQEENNKKMKSNNTNNVPSAVAAAEGENHHDDDDDNDEQEMSRVSEKQRLTVPTSVTS